MEWIDKRDGLDDIYANDINTIAHACIDLEQAVDAKATVAYVDEKAEHFDSVIGDIGVALDKIIEIQETLIGDGE